MVDLEGGRLEVLAMDLHRIVKVRFDFQVAEEAEDAEATAVEEPVSTVPVPAPSMPDRQDTVVTSFKNKTGS